MRSRLGPQVPAGTAASRGGGAEQGSAVPCKDPRAGGPPRESLGAPSGASGMGAGGRPRGVGASGRRGGGWEPRGRGGPES